MRRPINPPGMRAPVAPFSRGRVVTLVLTVAATIWLGSTGVGFTSLRTPPSVVGAPAAAPEKWPADSKIERTAARATLVVILHPRCSSSVATLEELSLMIALSDPGVAADVVLVDDGGKGTYRVSPALQRVLGMIPDATVIHDDGGIEARRFAATTSGQTMLYDNKGLLLFSGGVTAADGQFGNNRGRIGVVALLAGRKNCPTRAPVFGCRI